MYPSFSLGTLMLSGVFANFTLHFFVLHLLLTHTIVSIFLNTLHAGVHFDWSLLFEGLWV